MILGALPATRPPRPRCRVVSLAEEVLSRGCAGRSGQEGKAETPVPDADAGRVKTVVPRWHSVGHNHSTKGQSVKCRMGSGATPGQCQDVTAALELCGPSD